LPLFLRRSRAWSAALTASRMPFETEFIQEKLLATGALDDLNEDARYVLYVVSETGMRPSEVVNLQEDAIRLDTKIPYVKIQPDGRKLKTEDSEREIPLVGVALAAMTLRPKRFPRYRDKSSSLSATVNKFLRVNGLRPTKDHSVYSLRHSFKDRLVAVGAPDSLINSLMGHKTYKPKYGKGPSLELKLKYLQQIAFKARPRCRTARDSARAPWYLPSFSNPEAQPRISHTWEHERRRQAR
jgi:integrase